MEKKIAIALTVIVAVSCIAIVCFAGCTKKNEPVRQSASAYLDQTENKVEARVDLSDGYSCEFAQGAVYLFDQEINESAKEVAIGITLEEDVYNDYLAHSQEDANRKEINGGIMFSTESQTIFIQTVGDSAYFAVFADNVTMSQMESIAARFTVTPAV